MTKSKAAFLFASQTLGKQRLYLWTFTFRELLAVKETRKRWNHLLTLVAANQGLFASRLETRNAIAFEPRAQQYLLYTQNWWRNVLGHPNLELSFGAAWFPGSYHDVSWSSLNYYAWRDQLWFEFTYYLL